MNTDDRDSWSPFILFWCAVLIPIIIAVVAAVTQ